MLLGEGSGGPEKSEKTERKNGEEGPGNAVTAGSKANRWDQAAHAKLIPHQG
jgi:hypothetical protein